MKYHLLQLSARIRAICILLALFLVPDIVQAEDVYLLTAQDINGTTGTYSMPNNHKFTNSSGTVYTYTIKSMPATGFWFRIGVQGWKDDNMQPYTNDYALTINGDSYKIQTGCYGKDNAWKVSYKEGEYESLTITVDVSESNRYVKITGEKSSTGGGTSTTVNQPGIYLYGSDFGATSSKDHLHYKFVRKNDSEYHFALYAGYMKYPANLYGGNNTDITPSWNNKSFTIAYIDADGKFSTFCPSGNYTLTGSGTNSANAKDFGSNTQWTIQDNGGMYDLVVKVDANGKPTSWHYESDANKVVAYKASSTSNWTTEGFLYCVKDASSDAKAYCQNFFGTTPMVKDEEFKFILGNYWFGKKESEIYDLNVSIANGSTDAPNLKSPYDGIYPIEFNPSRTDYQLAGKDETPLRIFMIGSALNSNLTDTYTDWDPTQAVELVYDKDEQCYKGTVSLAKGKQFRFLRDKNASGSATSLDLNFGEDSNVPGETGSTDTDNNNYVAYNGSSASGKNITFNPETNIYNVRFYIEAGTKMDGFTWDAAKYRYTIELPTRLNATITPPSATVNYAASLTPKVGVVGTNAAKRKYAFTIDGSDPTIDANTGLGTGTTVVRDYDYDPVVPTNDVYTFYMSSADQLTYIDLDGNEHTLDGNTVTVKAQAVQTITENSKYRLEGNIATGTYTFKTAGIKPAGSYTISVTNDDETYNTTDKPSINKVTATVKVENTETHTDDGVDVYYTIDGSDPAKVGNAGARLVKNRKIEVYGIVNLEHGAENYIRVAIAGSEPLGDDVNDDDEKTHAHCKFDLTCSTSEGEYINYRDGYTDPKLKTYGGDRHIVVYIMPWTSKYGSQQESKDNIWPQNGFHQSYNEDTQLDDEYQANNVTGLRVPFIYAYENIVKDGVVKSKALTHATHTINIFTDLAEGLPTKKNEVDPENNPPYFWYYVDLAPDEGYKEVNIEMGYYDLMTDKVTFTPATIANVHNDMFLIYDVATGQIKDVTHEFTGDHFYTIGEGGTKSEPANPAIGEHFFYAQVPEAWTINNNSVKVLQKDGSELSGATVTPQGSAETSYLSKVYKITLSKPLDEGAELTIQPYHGDQGSSQKLTVNYVNGGYYFYESETHKTTNAPLVFSADADGDVQDQRPYGHRDINHTLETTPGARVKKEGCSAYGDFTYYLSPHWKDNSDNEVPTTTVTDNWNGKSATVNTIAAGTTISQTVDLHTAGQGLYTVQMIVRGEKGATATLHLEGSDFYGDEGEEGDETEGEGEEGEYSEGEYSEGENSGETEPTEQPKPIGNKSNSDTKTFAGYDAQGTVTTDGYVEHLLKDTKNGWQKLETTASVGEEGTLTISLTAEDGDLQLSDVTLLRNANTPPDVLGVDEDGKPIYYYRPTIWTTAPTGKDVTEYDLTARQSANAFSFFDRGENRNAVIYADKNTVLGMSENTYNVAVPTGYKSDNNSDESPAKGGTVFRASGSDVQTGLPFENATGHALVWEDEPNAKVNDNTWGTSAQITWDRFSWNRKFLGMSANSGKRNTIFLPFAMSNDQITAIFGTDAKIYKITSVNTEKLEVTGTKVPGTDPNTREEVLGTKPNEPYILELPETWEKDGVSYDDKLVTYYSKYDSKSTDITSPEKGTQGQFVGVYKFTNITPDTYEEGYDYYGYDANRNGIFNFFSKNGARFKPFRAYLKIKKPSTGSKPFYYFVVDEGGTTGIDSVSATTLSDDAPVYNLQGQLVRQVGQHTQLPKGLYIQNGRKFVQQ